VDAAEEGLVGASRTLRFAAAVTTPVLEEAALRGAQAAVATWTAAAPVAAAAASQATSAVQQSSAVAVRSAAQAVAVGSKAASEAVHAVAVHGSKAVDGVAAVTEVASHHLAAVRPDGLVNDVTTAARAAPKAALHALEVHAPAVLDAADHALDAVEHSVLPAAAGAAQALSRTVSSLAKKVAHGVKRGSSAAAPVGTTVGKETGKKAPAIKPAVPPSNKKTPASHPPAKPAAAAPKPVLGLPALPLPAGLKPPPMPPLPQLPPMPQLPGLPALPLPVRSATDTAVKTVATSMQALLRLMEQGILQQGLAPSSSDVASPAASPASSDTRRARGFTLGAALFYALLAVCVKARCDVATPQEAASMAALGAKLAALGVRLRDSTQMMLCNALDAAGMGPSKGTHLRLKVAIWEAEGRMGAKFHWHKSDQAGGPGDASGALCAASHGAGEVGTDSAVGAGGGEGGDASAPGPGGATSRVNTSRKAALIALVAEAHDSDEDGAQLAAPVGVPPAPSAGQAGAEADSGEVVGVNGEAATSPAAVGDAMHVRVWHAATRPAVVPIPSWLAAAAVACGTSRPAQALGHAVSTGLVHALVIAGDSERTVTHFTITAAKDAARQLVQTAHSLNHPSEFGRAAMAAVRVDAATVRVCRDEQWALPSAVPASGGWNGWALLPSVSFRFSISWDWLPRPPKPEKKQEQEKVAKAVTEHGNGKAETAVKVSALQASTSASSLRGPPTPPASPPWVKPPTASEAAATAAPPAKAPGFVQAVAAAAPSPSVLKAVAAFNGAAALANGTPPKPGGGEGSVAWRRAIFSAKEKAAPSTPASPAAAAGPVTTPGSGGIAARMAAFEKK
jgi:hypothetical protein